MKEQAFPSREIAREGTRRFAVAPAWLLTAAGAFVVSAPAGAVPGGHAHVRARQILMRVSGNIDVHARVEGDMEYSPGDYAPGW